MRICPPGKVHHDVLCGANVLAAGQTLKTARIGPDGADAKGGGVKHATST
jgi:hypothetical protein